MGERERESVRERKRVHKQRDFIKFMGSVAA